MVSHTESFQYIFMYCVYAGIAIGFSCSIARLQDPAMVANCTNFFLPLKTNDFDVICIKRTSEKDSLTSV